MSATLRLQMRQRLTGLKVHSVTEEAAEVVESKAAWLLNLEAEAEKKEQDRQASLTSLESISRELSKTASLVLENLSAITALSTELGLSLAREIVGDALDKGLVDPTPTVLRTLQSVVLSTEDAGISISLPAEDFSAVVASLQDLPEFAPYTSQVGFLVDPSLPRGSVRIETGAGRLQYEPQQVLDKLCEEVRRGAGA